MCLWWEWEESENTCHLIYICDCVFFFFFCIHWLLRAWMVFLYGCLRLLYSYVCVRACRWHVINIKSQQTNKIRKILLTAANLILYGTTTPITLKCSSIQLNVMQTFWIFLTEIRFGSDRFMLYRGIESHKNAMLIKHSRIFVDLPSIRCGKKCE